MHKEQIPMKYLLRYMSGYISTDLQQTDFSTPAFDDREAFSQKRYRKFSDLWTITSVMQGFDRQDNILHAQKGLVHQKVTIVRVINL